MSAPVDLPPPPPPLDTVVETTTTHTETLVAPADAVETYFPSHTELAVVMEAIGIDAPTAVDDATAVAWKPTKWWKHSDKEMDVDVNGHDFDFKPTGNVHKEKVSGFVDGPWSHNGGYKIIENSGKRLIMEMHVGTDAKQTNDMQVRIWIEDGQATLTGTVKGKDVGGATAKVTGKGTSDSPWKAVFKTDSGESHTITWKPD